VVSGVCEAFHKTVLNEFYGITFRKKLYQSLQELQSDLDDWFDEYNHERTHQGKRCEGKTPMQTFFRWVEIGGTEELGHQFHEAIRHLSSIVSSNSSYCLLLNCGMPRLQANPRFSGGRPNPIIYRF
jgi:hypothetical protein